MNEGIATIQLCVQSMRFHVRKALDHALIEIDTMVQKQLEDLCRPENLERVIRAEAERHVNQEIARLTINYLNSNQGKAYIQEVFENRLKKIRDADPNYFARFIERLLRT